MPDAPMGLYARTSRWDELGVQRLGLCALATALGHMSHPVVLGKGKRVDKRVFSAGFAGRLLHVCTRIPRRLAFFIIHSDLTLSRLLQAYPPKGGTRSGPNLGRWPGACGTKQPQGAHQMFEVLRTNCDGVCAGNWGRKEKRAMGFDIPHRTLAQNLLHGIVRGMNRDGAALSARKEAAKMTAMADDAMI